ncbi:MAG: tyrosine-type recombinase/integrase, partial [Candidatus Cloacimonetes bacterium]|nr:tyrosine-type recombinase/integrase [Candidatus Cloacimonadota bacterium]
LERDWSSDLKLLKRINEFKREEVEKLKLNSNQYSLNSNKLDANFVVYFKALADKYQGNTKRNWYSVYKYLYSFSNGIIKFSDIDEKVCEDLKDYMLTKLSVNSTIYYFSKLNQALDDAIYKHKLPMLNYFKRVKHARPTDPPIRYLTEYEVEQLISNPYPNERVTNPFLFSVFTGLRLSDTKALIFENIKNDRLSIVQIKTKKPLDVLLNPNAIKILDRQKELINSDRGKVFNFLDDDYMNKRIKEWVKSLGINKKITFHCGRHTFATIGITSGMDIYEVSGLLGHTDIKHTLIYAKLVNKKKDKAALKYPNFL